MTKYVCAMLILALAGCSNPKPSPAGNMDGAYNMLSQTFKGNAIDTTFTAHKQLKIYAGRYMMYVRVNPADSVSAFGIGTFSMDSGKLTENILYSATDTTENTSPFSGTVNIVKNSKGYEQVIPEIMSDKGKLRLTEEYESVGTNATSPLDGTWKQTKGYTYKGKDTVYWHTIKYKVFYAGNFVHGNYFSGPGHKSHVVITYGIFVMNDSNHIKETITASTSTALNGKTVTLDIALQGADAFTQTIAAENGATEVDVFRRLRK